MKNKKILKALNDKKLLAVFDTHLDSKTSESLSNNLETLKKNEFIVPVLGVQGVGKSSFLNALLLDNAILPVAAAETTCIPTEIRYSPNPSKNASVYYENGKVEKVLAHESELKNYIDNEININNDLKIRKVVVESNAELLKNGLVLVDLPGTGSLTFENEKRAFDYIDNSSGCILLVTDRIDKITFKNIDYVWLKLCKLWFVKNRWVSDDDKNTTDSSNHILAKIKSTAREMNQSDKDIDLSVIQVAAARHASITGKFESDEYRKSGIVEFKNKLLETAMNWKEAITNILYSKVALYISNTSLKISCQLEDLSKNKEELKEELKKTEELFKSYISEAEGKVKKIKNRVEVFNEDFNENIKSILEESGQTFRTEIRKLILKTEATDGSALDDVFSEQVMTQKDFIIENAIKLSNKFKSEIQNIPELSTLREWFNFEFEYGSKVGIPEKTKWEKTTKRFIEVGGVTAGAIGGALLPLIGGPFGVFLLPFVPFLASFGAAVGGLVGKSLGWAIDKGVVKYRISKAMPIVEKEVEKFHDSIKAFLDSSIGNMYEGISKKLNEWTTKQKQVYQEEYSGKINLLKSDEATKNKLLNQMQEDLSLINEYQKDFSIN